MAASIWISASDCQSGIVAGTGYGWEDEDNGGRGGLEQSWGQLVFIISDGYKAWKFNQGRKRSMRGKAVVTYLASDPVDLMKSRMIG